MIQRYSETEEKYTVLADKAKRITGLLSILRLISLVLCLFFIYKNIQNSSLFFVSAFVFLGVVFIYLISLHQKYKNNLRIIQTFAFVNCSEKDFILNNTPYYPNGAEFLSDNHPFAYDIDLFGTHSLYEHLNRTSTIAGSTKLAQDLSGVVTKEELKERQDAIEELAHNFDWIQSFQVFALLGKDNAATHKSINSWKNQSFKFTIATQISSYLFPILGATTMLLLWKTGISLWFNLGVVLFLVNMACFGFLQKKIKAEIDHIDKIGSSLIAYGKMLKLITSNNWKSSCLNTLKESLVYQDKTAHAALMKAGKIYNNLESANNGLVVMLLNGTIQYHIHVYRKLLKWKNTYQEFVATWIEQIGRMESLVSLAIFKANNPTYVFPEIHSEISFSDLGHPLIPSNIRVNNTIDFSQQQIAILTGSNMSGKSTFLRSIGAAISLANAGSVIPASKARFYPIHLLASIRLSDSLAENSSYFFSEVSRLKSIMEFLSTQKAFVLLDEILRGTNSEDKIAGTVGVIEKLVQKNASGIIATHDLEVCKLEQKLPENISNYCFEAEIENNKLNFDYKLRKGICKNKSATFIMKQNNII